MHVRIALSHVVKVLDLVGLAELASGRHREELAQQFGSMDQCFATASDIPSGVSHKKRC